MQEIAPYVISAITLLIIVVEKLFGGGNALANRFNHLSEKTKDDIAALRQELTRRTEDYQAASTTGFETIRTNIHLMQTALLEFRAKMAEELHSYIRKDDYNVGMGNIKGDVQDGFKRIDDQLGKLQDLILHFGGDEQRPHTTGRKT